MHWRYWLLIFALAILWSDKIAAASIRGVVFVDGSPARRDVQLVGPHITLSLSADDQGRFTFEGLPSGNYELFVASDSNGFPYRVCVGTVDRSVSLGMPFSDESCCRLVVCQSETDPSQGEPCEPPPIEVAGSVVDFDDVPLDSAEILMPSGEITWTDSKGAFRMPGGDAFTIQVARGGYQTELASIACDSQTIKISLLRECY